MKSTYGRSYQSKAVKYQAGDTERERERGKNNNNNAISIEGSHNSFFLAGGYVYNLTKKESLSFFAHSLGSVSFYYVYTYACIYTDERGKRHLEAKAVDQREVVAYLLQKYLEEKKSPVEETNQNETRCVCSPFFFSVPAA